jgi:hypothetical protein
VWHYYCQLAYQFKDEVREPKSNHFPFLVFNLLNWKINSCLCYYSGLKYNHNSLTFLYSRRSVKFSTSWSLSWTSEFISNKLNTTEVIMFLLWRQGHVGPSGFLLAHSFGSHALRWASMDIQASLWGGFYSGVHMARNWDFLPTSMCLYLEVDPATPVEAQMSIPLANTLTDSFVMLCKNHTTTKLLPNFWPTKIWCNQYWLF